MKTCSSIIALALTIARLRGASAAPTVRRDNEMSIDDFARSALVKFLGTYQVKEFRAIPGGRQVSWVGENAPVNEFAGNSDIFGACDPIVAADGNGTTPSFSDAYKNFVQDVGSSYNLTSTNNGTSPELNAAKDAQDQKCTIEFDQTLDKLIKQAINASSDDPWAGLNRRQNDQGPPDSTNSTAASGGGKDQKQEKIWNTIRQMATYKQANADCEKARLAYETAFDKENGKDFALVYTAFQNIESFTGSDPQAKPGITMPLDPDAKEDVCTDISTCEAGHGNYLPEYRIPLLNATVIQWMNQDPSAAPEFSFDSSKDHSYSSDELNSASAGVDVSIGRFGAGGSTSSTSGSGQSSTTAQKFSVSYAGLALMDIEQGLWFDNYRLAQACESPVDDKSEQCKSAFEKNFGTKDKPLTAATYNTQLLVAYQPSWSMTFASSDQMNSFSESEFSAHANYLFASANASGKKVSDFATADNSTNTVSYQPKEKIAIILGAVPAHYAFKS